MITEIKKLLEHYKEIQRHSEYVSVGEVVNHLHYLLQDTRVKRLPKDER